MTKKLENKVAIITGAGSGIGKAAAIRLAKSGAKIGLIDLKEENARKVKDEIESFGGEALVTDTDISKAQEVESSIQTIIEQWGQIDFVFANAGINGRVAPIEDLTSDDWDQTLGVNLKGTFLTVKYVIPYT